MNPHANQPRKGEPARTITGTSAKNCPRITEGELTHSVLQRYLTNVKNWCTAHHATIAEMEFMPYLTPGFSENARLDNLYYQGAERYNKMTPTHFIETVRTHIFGNQWHLDVHASLDTFYQCDLSFMEFYDTMLAQNRLLKGNVEHLDDTQFLPLIKSRIHPDLRIRCSTADSEISKLYITILGGSADPNNDETIEHWAALVAVEDEKLRRKRDRRERETRLVLSDLKRVHSNTFQSNMHQPGSAMITTPVQSSSQASPALQSFPPFSNTFYSPNVAAMAQSQSSFHLSLPPQTQTGLQVMLAPHYNDLEKWIMFVLAYFCIQCRFPFQNHCKTDNVCEPCHAVGYEIHDINFINCWVQAHPNGFENRRVPDPSVTPQQPHMITNEEIAHHVNRVPGYGGQVPQYFLNVAQQAGSSIPKQNPPTSSSNSIPLGSSAHNVAPLQSIPQNYVAPILYKHSFPPMDGAPAPASRPPSHGDTRPLSRHSQPSS